MATSSKKTQGTRSSPATNFPAGYVQLAVNTATSFTASQIPDGAIMCMVVIEAQTVRWRDDGTAPTATVGMPLTVAQTMIYTGDFTKIQFIAATAGGIVNASFYT